MYNVSEEYIEKINSLSKKVYWYGTVTLTNGTVYPFDTSNMSGGNTSITRDLCNASSLKMGGTCSGELKIELMLDYDGEYYRLNGLIVNRYEFTDAEVKLYFRLFLDDNDEENYEEIPMGSFIVSDTERKQLILSLTAYDYMQKFGKTCISTIQGTPYNVLLGACATCGVELGNSYTEIANMINGKKSVAMYDPKNQISTWRDVIGYIAEMLGGNATIKYDNKLYIVPFKENYIREFTPNNRVSLTLADYVSNYNSLTATNLRNNTEDKLKKANGGLTYSMGANPLMQYVTNSERQTVLNQLLNLLYSFEYVPFDGEFYCDPSIELGDVIAFSGNHAMELTKAIVTQIQLSCSGHMSMKCEGDNPYLATATEAADRESSENKGGSVGEGVTFYDFTNESAWVFDDEVQIVSFVIDANGNYRNEFMCEVLMTIATTESTASNVYQETDCEVTATYFINGTELGSYKPKETYLDGSHVLNLFYPWTRDTHVDTNTFEVRLSVTGGTVSIGANDIKARIMQSGTAYPILSNEIAYIEVETPPTNEMYWRNQAISYSGIKIVAEYEDGRKVDITNQCSFSPANGTIVRTPKSLNVTVAFVNGSDRYYTAFYMEEIIPEELVVTPPPSVMYFADAHEYLNYTGLNVQCKYSDGTQRDVTSECYVEPSNETEVTVYTPTYAIVTYIYYDYTITDGFDLDIVLPDSLVITPPSETTYYLDIEDRLDYDGLVVTLKYDNGYTRDITDLVTITPPDNSLVTRLTPNYVTVTYSYVGGEVTDGFDIEIEEVEFDLKYFEYTQNDSIHRIIITGLKPSQIVADNLKNLKVPNEIVNPETGIVYSVWFQ